jgi:hypothetical protein
MSLEEFRAFATTRDIAPGTEQLGPDGIVHIRDRGFTDVLESDDARIAGSNRPLLALDFDPRAGSGRLWGPFEITVNDGGTWRGELRGVIEAGAVRAWGIAVGSGSLAGRTLRVDFQQVERHPQDAPCPEPKAFFQMQGYILGPE